MIVTIGEAIIDFIQGPDGRYDAAPGGAPANVAITVARLGAPAAFAGRLSCDRFGLRLRQRLTANGVDVIGVMDAPEPTTLAIASIGANGSAEYAFYLEGTADWGWAAGDLDSVLRDPPDAVHFGSLAAAIEPGSLEIERLIRRLADTGRTVVSYDVNCRPAIGLDHSAERRRVERQIRPASLVKASDEDLAWLYPDRAAEDVASVWAVDRFVLVTRGSEGARLYRPTAGPIAIAAVPVDVVDTVGAGDATCGGLLTALNELGALGRGLRGLMKLRDDDWCAALEFATDVAAMTCNRAGAEPPTKLELQLRRPGRYKWFS